MRISKFQTGIIAGIVLTTILTQVPGCLHEKTSTLNTVGGQVDLTSGAIQDSAIILRLKTELRQAQDNLAANQTPEQRAQAEEYVIALEAKIDEFAKDFAEKTGVSLAVAEQVASQIITSLTDPDLSLPEKVQAGVGAVTPFLPPPWGLAINAVLGIWGAGGTAVAANKAKKARNAADAGAAIANSIIAGIAGATKMEPDGVTAMKSPDGTLMIDPNVARNIHTASGVADIIEAVRKGTPLTGADILNGKA